MCVRTCFFFVMTACVLFYERRAGKRLSRDECSNYFETNGCFIEKFIDGSVCKTAVSFGLMVF